MSVINIPKEIIMDLCNASILGDPKTIRIYAETFGTENSMLYGFPGFLDIDISNKKLSDEILSEPQKNTFYEKLIDKQWRPVLGQVVIYDKPVGTIYCTDGKSKSYAVTDELKIAKLNKDTSTKDLHDVIGAISGRVAYFIGDNIKGAPTGVFTTLAHFYSDTLSSEELEKYPDIFTDVNGELRLSEKGDYMLDLFKETWDYTPKEIRSLCKLSIKPFLSELFSDIGEGIPIDVEDLKRHAEIKAVPEDLKIYIKNDIAALENIIDKGIQYYYFVLPSESKLTELEKQLEPFEDILSRKIDINRICETILNLAPKPSRPLKSASPSEKEYYRENIEWIESLKGAINVLKTRMSEVKTYGISPIKQLELLEKGGYISLYEEYDSSLNMRTKIFRGPNFRYLDDAGGVFCPIGLADKWDTWKIERLGNMYTLTKYFKNVDSDLLRISVNNLGEIRIEGSAEPVFEEPIKREIELIEEIINYGLPQENRIPLKWKNEMHYEAKSKPVSDEMSLLSKISREGYPELPKKKTKKPLTRADERLLRKIRRRF